MILLINHAFEDFALLHMQQVAFGWLFSKILICIYIFLLAQNVLYNCLNVYVAGGNHEGQSQP